MGPGPQELEERYRRFLEGRGDIVDPLISLLRGDHGERADSRAWAALILSRIYLLKGRLDLAASYLRLSSTLFRSVEAGVYPLGIWVNRAIILKARGMISQSENLLRRVFSLALRGSQIFTAAKAASNLASILARSDRLDDSASFLAVAERSYQALGCSVELVRVDLTRALIESRRRMFDEAVERICVCLNVCEEKTLQRESVIGELLLVELFMEKGDYVKAEKALSMASSRTGALERFRPQYLRFLYLRQLLYRKMGEPEAADRILKEAEALRLGLGFGCLDLGYSDSVSAAYPAPDTERSSCIMPAESGAVYCVSKGSATGGRKESEVSASMLDIGEYPVHPPGDAGSRAGTDPAGIFITKDPRMLAILEEIRSAAPLPLPVLLCGESGVGKDIIARLIHLWSGRGKEPLISVNAAALPRDLFESAFFGHSRGAFTGAVATSRGLLGSAGHGTVFLDEIGELEPALQAKLLRLLDRGEYIPLGENSVKRSHARIIAATNRDIESDVESGSFRKDLYYRLAVLAFSVPPLRERRGDIAILSEYFLQMACRLYGLGPMELGRGALEILSSYDWPGNVRELQNEIIRAAVRKGKGVLRICHFSANLLSGAVQGSGGAPGTLESKVRELERTEIATALQDS
ncbi:MAG: sigma-54-dependent Fis family transcriptional regulator, partial [Candidatus Krumholzibacteria bacterium]|nr:sigma-54-dependent Fis family transcriptional regulator [Candidatus Krumholzibacteria bacterium]